ncbi:uncharacterized protein LOC124491410 [Dermatophagoides farinae]|uniref:Uncharacterized protein n=1 Tax=Dermatophagoides farinae TaxID=6954 RepID=A0A9D4P1V2_DERFA|nr:uncharacterized protein LOC124491410 [Dermatophagoides farinae]KAH7642072.1 hypothetical protein HUG17_5117 [Dermatophagoides farinae]
MASMQNFFTIILLATTTFIVLDLSKNDSFNKSATGKYLNKIGVGPHLQRFINTIIHSEFYRQYVLPAYNSLIRTLAPHMAFIRKETIKYGNHVSVWFKNTFPSLLQTIERKVIPAIAEHYSHFVVYTQKYWTVTYSKMQEISLITGEWINQNVFTKFPRDQLLKTFNEFIANTQKMAYNSYEYLASQIQKFIAA